jgi:ABC-type multidrug transport system fused ATPase/permease subunit
MSQTVDRESRGMLRTYYEALAGYRRLGAGCVILLFLSGVSEAFGIAALLPLLSTRLSSSAGGQKEYLGISGDALTLLAIGALVVLGTLAAVLRWAGEGRSYVLAVKVERSLRSRMLAAILGMRWTEYMGITVGEGLKSVLVEGGQVGAGGLAVVQALGNLGIAIVFFVVAAVITPVLTAAVVIFGGFTAVVYRKVGRKAQALSRDLSGLSARLSESATDLLTNAKFYRSTGLDGRAVELVDEQFADWASSYGRVQRYLPTTRLAFDAAGLGFIAAVLLVSLYVLDMSIAGPLVFLALFYRLAPRLQASQQAYLQARTQVAWWHTWKEQYDRALAAADRPSGTHRLDGPPRVDLDNVTLTFPGRSVPAVAGVSCTIAPGECLAVVGASGGGKTTVIDLITGLLEPTAGCVRLDGLPLHEVDLAQWRSHIGLVMQESPVFYGTVLENVAWTDPQPNEARARHAVEMANLVDVVERLPEGIHTHLGQRGGRFSGGQRQRLALARALYRDPWLLILDEATSALDSESEQVIQAALASLRGSCSMLVVAHRLKTVEIADEILVLSHGKVVEAGTWHALSATDGVFHRMLRAQATGAGARPA